ncbi:hypothetical protein V8G54_016067 [Vigna mungo]|uniref:THH1/TOM1/TOM3 domain-containing protein n=1 Tax=Vigna mungo TaxID=3915 RepID=A0AAQ3RZ01_VIGMU
MRNLLLSLPPFQIAPLFTVSTWWDQINASTRWQTAVFFFLCAAYALVAFIALVQLVRIEVRVPEYVRAVVFGLHKLVFLLQPKVGFAPCDVWLLIARLARGLPTDKLKILYVSVNAVLYIIQVCIWIYLWIDDNSAVEFIGEIFIAVVSFMAALGFLIYGGRLFFMLRRFPIESKGRRKKLNEVGSVTAICFTCFLIRCVMGFLSAFDSDASLDVLDHPLLDLIYYMLVEILPSALVLYILRKLPPKRISAQYHPIR